MGRENYIQLRGMWDIRHWIRVPSMNDVSKAEALKSKLESVEGVAKVLTYPGKRKIRVIYDQSVIDYQAIVKSLTDIDFPPSDSWWSRTKGRWFQYLDEKIKARAHSSPS